MSDEMTRRDRQDLAQLARQRARVAKAAATQRAAELKADVEAQLAAVFQAEDERWASIVAEAKELLKDVDAKVAAICERDGVPPQFRPSLNAYWSGRGTNADPDRRAELRRVAVTRIDALKKTADAEIDRKSLEVQTELMAGGLDTSAARAFLESMPTAKALMPMLSVAEVEAAVPLPKPDRRRYLDA